MGRTKMRTTPWTSNLKYFLKISNEHHDVVHGRALVQRANVRPSAAAAGAACTAGAPARRAVSKMELQERKLDEQIQENDHA
jgi:hypothetical protein